MSCKEAKLIKRKVENFISKDVAQLFDDYAYLISSRDAIVSFLGFLCSSYLR